VIRRVISIPEAIKDITWGKLPWPECPWNPTKDALLTWNILLVKGIFSIHLATSSSEDQSYFSFFLPRERTNLITKLSAN